MTSRYGHEPFPLFVDSNAPSQPNYFSPTINILSILNAGPSRASSFRPQSLIPVKVENYVRLKYYQYEVTFGLYMLTPNEKVVMNTVVLGIFALLACGVVFGLHPLIVRLVCRLVWYVTGAHEGVEEICAQ